MKTIKNYFESKCFELIKLKKNNNISKKRNPGVDFIRILAMYGIIINHFLYGGGFMVKSNKYKNNIKIFHILLFWHNNGFGIISGIVGYKTNKYSNILNLWFCVFFYSVSIYYYFHKFKVNSIINNNIFIELFPVIYNRYWYFSSYFGMYLFIPAINKAVANLTKSELKLIVSSLLLFFSFWHYFMNSHNDVFHLNRGNSLLWLLTLYLVGTYIGKYRIHYTGKKKFFFCFYLFLIYLSMCYIYYTNYSIQSSKEKNKCKRILYIFPPKMISENYDSFIKMIQSLSIILFLMQINYDKYSTKIISFIGPLTFGIYLIHTNSIFVQNIIKRSFQKVRNNISLDSMIVLVLMKCLKIFVFCCFIEYMRYILFMLLGIRKICIFIEKIIWKII